MFKATTIILLTVLISLSASGDESRYTDESRYYTIDIMGKRIGYSDYFLCQMGSDVRVASETFISVKMLGQPYDITYQALGIYSLQMKPKRYAVTLAQAGMVTEIYCEFSEKQVKIRLTVGDSTTTKTAQIGDFVLEGNLMDTWNLMFRSMGEITGTRRLQVFSPILGDTTEIEVKLLNVELLPSTEGEEYCNVYKVIFTKLAEEMKLWVTKSDKTMLKMEVPEQQAVIQISRPEDLGEIEEFEALSRVFALSNVLIPNWKDLTYMKTRIKVEAAGELFPFNKLQSDFQKFDGVRHDSIAEGIIETRRYEYQKQNPPPFPMEKVNVDEAFLKPEFNIESDIPDIVAKAQELTIDAADSWNAVHKIATWVFQNIEYKITGGSAKQALVTGEGDCGPHTMLTIALCRAAGIPARIIGGVLYSSVLQGSFGQHYWTEVWMDEDGWIPLDSTTGEIGTLSPAHITLWYVGGVKSLEAEVLEYEPKPKEDDTEPIATSNISWAPGDYRKYTLVKKGEKIGEQSAKVERQLVYESQDALEISETLTLSLPGIKADLQAILIITLNGKPLKWTVEANVNSALQKLDCTFELEQIINHLELAGQKIDRKVSVPEHILLGGNNWISNWSLMTQTLPLEVGKTVKIAMYTPSAMQSMSVTFECKDIQPIKIDGESIECLAVNVIPIGETFYLNRQGEIVRIIDERQNLVIDMLVE